MNRTLPLQNRTTAAPPGVMKKLALAALGAVTLLSALPAMADVIGFQSLTPNIYNGTEVIAESGYAMTVIDSAAGSGVGFAGAVLDGSDPYVCAIAACPGNNATQYYAGVNDGSLKITRDNQGFMLGGLDYAFLAPVGGLVNAVYGQLTLIGTTATGTVMQSSLDFAATDGNGIPQFSMALLRPDFSHTAFTELTIGSCLFDGKGGCQAVADNKSQFAIDNLVLTAVPEAETWAMMLAGLAIMGATRRRATRATRAAHGQIAAAHLSA